MNVLPSSTLVGSLNEGLNSILRSIYVPLGEGYSDKATTWNSVSNDQGELNSVECPHSVISWGE